MTERPILFSAPMVRAILDGKKTQTRRVVKPTQSTPRVAPLTMEPWLIEMSDGSFDRELDPHGLPCWIGTHPDYPSGEKWFSCPYGAPGDTLWVRETWNCISTGITTQRQDWVRYRATDGEELHWRPSIHMPRWASRLTLRITEVRVERVQDITGNDVIAEGIEFPAGTNPQTAWRDRWMPFSTLWDSINAKRGYGWDVNPWVWVLSFEVLK